MSCSWRGIWRRERRQLCFSRRSRWRISISCCAPSPIFCGAGAYVAEILILTDGFRRKVPQKELFMAYCFGPLYILLGLSYLLEA